LLPGTDPDHKDELVIIGAHYDHLGRDPDGAIFNGANDNASGVATMLEIARLWHAQGYRPARSVLFVGWDNEESGLVGSEHYVSDPVYPLAKTVAVLNLDMAGVGDEVHINGEGIVAAQFQASAQVYSTTTFVDVWAGGSDHFPFYEAGLPASMFAWYMDEVYHTPADDIQNIQPDRLRTIGVIAAHALAAWSGGGPTSTPPPVNRYLWDIIIPTPTCDETTRPPGAMLCDHGTWLK